ncbi:MAG: hypothetical protein ACRDHZ_26185, partial [Ktedonobacteraceae bacterium]
HLVNSLMSSEPAFHCYAEAAHSGGRRIDLIAFDLEIALAIEAKTFGNIGRASNEAIGDIDRLNEFSPIPSRSKENILPANWWKSANERIGILLVGSHSDVKVRQAWSAKDLVGATNAIDQRARGSRLPIKSWSRENQIFLRLVAKLIRQQAVRGSCSICESQWFKTDDAYLLYAIFSLDSIAYRQAWSAPRSPPVK